MQTVRKIVNEFAPIASPALYSTFYKQSIYNNWLGLTR